MRRVLARCRALDNVDVDVDCQKESLRGVPAPKRLYLSGDLHSAPGARILDLIFVFFVLGLRQSVLRLCPTGRQSLGNHISTGLSFTTSRENVSLIRVVAGVLAVFVLVILIFRSRKKAPR